MAGCVTEDIKETGISRSTAEGIAERHCPQYPDKYGYVDQSEWNSDGKFWMVALTDRDGDHGKAYKISRSGEIIDSHAIDRDSEDYSHHYYGPGSWYYW
jgi:hypothetical protein